ELISLGEYGQAARLYARLLRLEPDNDRIPILHSEMLRMAREAEEKAGSRAKPSKSADQLNAAAVRG
ncbi:MAG TPA: hypothetical protein VM409_07785, partial [Chloroflexia bacterium]|nr:hypothetical protein [Chloroflexia bacterium]